MIFAINSTSCSRYWRIGRLRTGGSRGFRRCTSKARRCRCWGRRRTVASGLRSSAYRMSSRISSIRAARRSRAIIARIFVRLKLLKAPRTSVAAWVICAETDAEAERLSFSFRMMMTLLFRGQSIPVPTPERAERFLAEEGLMPASTPPNRRMITGTPARVREAIETLARDYEAEEVFVVNIMHDHAARRRSYELIAEAFGIG